MKAEAKRNDSWLGISKGKVYEVEIFNGVKMVHTDGYTVVFNEKDFILIDDKN